MKMTPTAALSFLVFCLLRSGIATDTCSGRCGNYDTNTYSCQCSEECIGNGNCCSDYNVYCDTSATCQNRNCYGDNKALPCQCNDACTSYNDCCPDYVAICKSGGSCEGRCGPGTDSGEDCQCNSYCVQYGDCCDDYEELCTDSTCTRLTVSDKELLDISKQLWDLDENAADESDIEINLQSQAVYDSTSDFAPEPFFTFVNEVVLQREMFLKLEALQDNYIMTQGNTEVVTSVEEEEQDEFLDAFLATPIGQKLFEFLDSKGLAGCQGLDGFKTILKNIWFGLYNRKATDDTSGFEHSFVGEIKVDEVSGFHNWVKFYREELAGNFNYLGYFTELDPRLYGMTFTWHGAPKPYDGFTIGSSPEQEFALYTLCHLVKPNSVCNIQLSVSKTDKTEVNRSIQTYAWTKEYPPGGQSYIASAYFIS